MSDTNTGGPAFPCGGIITNDGILYEGMTIRDYFAAKAMQGLISDSDWRIDMAASETARAAYNQADAMLKAREQ